MGSECRVKRKKLTNRPGQKHKRKLMEKRKWGRLFGCEGKSGEYNVTGTKLNKSSVRGVSPLFQRLLSWSRGGAASRCPLDLAESVGHLDENTFEDLWEQSQMTIITVSSRS